MIRTGVVAVVLAMLLAHTAGAQSPAPLVGPFAKADYPQAVIDRPLTLPAGMVELETGFTFRSLQADDDGLLNADDWFADVAVRVGVTDRVQIEAGTAFALDHRSADLLLLNGRRIDVRPILTSWQRVVPVRLSLLALDTESLDTAVTLTLPFTASTERIVSVGPGRGVPLRFGNGRVLPAVELAAPTRWRVTDWLWLRAGENLFEVTTDQGIAQFAFDLGIGVQPHRLVAVTLDSRIASIAFDGSGHEASQTVADVGLIDLEGTFSPCRWFDVVGSLSLPVDRGFADYLTRIAFRARF